MPADSRNGERRPSAATTSAAASARPSARLTVAEARQGGGRGPSAERSADPGLGGGHGADPHHEAAFSDPARRLPGATSFVIEQNGPHAGLETRILDLDAAVRAGLGSDGSRTPSTSRTRCGLWRPAYSGAGAAAPSCASVETIVQVRPQRPGELPRERKTGISSESRRQAASCALRPCLHYPLTSALATHHPRPESGIGRTMPHEANWSRPGRRSLLLHSGSEPELNLFMDAARGRDGSASMAARCSGRPGRGRAHRRTARAVRSMTPTSCSAATELHPIIYEVEQVRDGNARRRGASRRSARRAACSS